MIRLLLSLYLLASISYSETLYSWKMSRVIDGDTIEFEVDFLPIELGNKLKLRVWGVDTPEKGFRAHNEQEAKLGEESSNFTKKLFQEAKEVKVQIIMWDKFGGRILGDVILDGKSLRQLLLDNNYAREYYGSKKESWY